MIIVQRRLARTLVCAATLLVSLALGAASQTNVAPTASFTAWRVDGTDPMTVQFDASSSRDSDGTIASAQWIFGDGTTGSGTAPIHTYSHVTSYSVTLVVTDNQGATALLVHPIDLATLSAQPDGASTDTAATVSNAPVGVEVGNRAVEISLPDTRGTIVNLSDFLGHAVLVDFWRSTCAACKSATPYMDDLLTRYEQQDLVVLLVVLDSSLDGAVTYLASRGFDRFVVVHEGDTGVKTTYGVSSIPHVVLVDPTGVIRYSGTAFNVTDTLLEAWL